MKYVRYQYQRLLLRAFPRSHTLLDGSNRTFHTSPQSLHRTFSHSSNLRELHPHRTTHVRIPQRTSASNRRSSIRPILDSSLRAPSHPSVIHNSDLPEPENPQTVAITVRTRRQRPPPTCSQLRLPFSSAIVDHTNVPSNTVRSNNWEGRGVIEVENIYGSWWNVN
jgi:hypothetical protein